MFYSARYPKSDWTELSCLPWKYPRPPKRLWAQSKPGGLATHIRGLGRTIRYSCCSRQSLLRRPMKGRSRACAKMGAHSLARACDGGGSYRNRPQLKNTRRRPSPARMPRRRILGAKFNGRFFFRRPTSHITGNCNTLKDNLILSLIRYVVAIKS